MIVFFSSTGCEVFQNYRLLVKSLNRVTKIGGTHMIFISFLQPLRFGAGMNFPRFSHCIGEMADAAMAAWKNSLMFGVS